MDRPVVVNSLLCFIQNYRDHPKLAGLVDDYFSKASIAQARQLIVELNGVDEGDLFSLFDQLGDDSCPVPSFVADDLSALPMTLVGDDDGVVKDELLRELRLLKRFIQDALNGKVDETPSIINNDSRSSAATPVVNGRCKMNTSASSPEFPLAPTTIPAPSSPKSTTSSRGPPAKKRALGGGKSLDDAVKKLTDRQRVGSTEPRSTENAENTENGGTSPPSTPTPTSTPWQTALDTQQAYLSIVRMMQNPQPSIFPAVVPPTAFPSMLDKDSEEKLDDLDDNDKAYDDSSPSPSEDIKDDFDMSSNDLEKPFTCEHANCHKRFANKFLLKKHQFIHTGLRPHTCPFCNKRFNRKDNLLRHKKTHTQGGLDDLARRHQLALFGAAGAIDLAQTLGLENEDDD